MKDAENQRHLSAPTSAAADDESAAGDSPWDPRLEVECPCGQSFEAGDAECAELECPACGEVLCLRSDEPETIQALGDEDESPWFLLDRAGSAFTLPLKHHGSIVIFWGVLFTAYVEILRVFFPLCALIAFWIGVAYFVRFSLTITLHAAEGGEELPSLPDGLDFLASAVGLMLRLSVATVASGIPSIVTAILLPPGQIQNDLVLAGSLISLWVFLLGITLVVVFSKSLSCAFRYDLIVKSILLTLHDYVIVCMISLVLAAIAILSARELLVGPVCVIYATMVYARLLGLYWRAARSRLEL